MAEMAPAAKRSAAAGKRELLQSLLAKRAVRRPSRFPLSFGQQRLWFLDQLDPGNPAYNMPSVERLPGAMRPPALQAALSEVVRRHEVLRTTVPLVEERPVQLVAPPRPVPLPLVDLSGLAGLRREPEARRLATVAALHRFDLERGPLLWAGLLRLAATDHILLLTVHHLACDGWSLDILGRELSTLYAAFASGLPSPLAELPLQYGDFAVWQRRRLDEEALERLLAFWVAALAGERPNLQLPSDRPRPPLPSGRGAACPVRVDRTVASALRELGRKRQTTLFMTLLSAFQLLLWRYTGQEDLAIGTPVSGRDRREIEGLIGFFVNTLVLPGRVRPELSFTELLARTREACLAAFAHQEMPFEKLVDELHLERDLAHTPLFQAMLTLDNAIAAPPAAGDRPPSIPSVQRTAKFDLSLLLTYAAPELSGLFEYSTDLFDATTIQRLSEHFARLLASVAAAPDRPLGDLVLADEAERHQLSREWNDTATSRPEEVLLADRIAALAARAPAALAVVAPGGRLTYGELDRRADRLAGELRRRGVKRESLVGLHLERSPDLVVAVLAVLKAGGAYLPLDPEYPAERLAFMLADSGARLLLTRPERSSGLALPAAVACLDPAAAAADDDDDLPVGAPARGALADNLAYVIYTSGSTGQPKGVAVPHRGLLNYLDWCREAYGVRLGSGSLVHTSLSFDLTVTSLLAPLAVGGWVELLPEEFGVEALCRALAGRTDVDLLKLTPVHLDLLNQQLSAADLRESALRVVVGGESLPAEAVERWHRLAPGSALFNEYGPTETVVGCAVWRLPGDRRVPDPVPIGRPIGNARLHVLDRLLLPVPLGVAGELCIGGTGVVRGYLNRPDGTAARFVPDPFATRPGERLYRSGDLARFLPEGTLEFLGRRDEQVKIRGYRIEPAEVAAVLVRNPAVQQAAVVPQQEPGRPLRLVAYLVPQPGASFDLAELREQARLQLPGYMVPSAFVALAELPLSPNGKLDRRALPGLGEEAAERAAYVPPRTPFEETLAAIWQEVLRVPAVGVLDNFFALGGDSILAVQAVSRANRAGLRLTPTQLFQYQTIADLAAEAERVGRTAALDEAGLPAAGPFSLSELAPEEIVRRFGPLAELEDLYPASPIQSAMLAYTLSHPGSEVGFEQVSCMLRGPLDAAAFRRAWSRVLDRHQALRTTYAWEGLERPLQVVRRGVALSLTEEDWREVPPGEIRARLDAWVAADRKRGFDLQEGPLMRLFLLRVEDEAHYVVWSNHHLLMDGWCRSLVLDEVLAFYDVAARGVSLDLEVPRPYRDYIAWLAARDLVAAEAFWRRTLAGFRQPTRLRLAPPPRSTAALPESYARHRVPVSRELTAELQQVARRGRLTFNTLLRGAWALLLERYSGSSDVVFGAIFSGRPADLPGAETMVGLFMNILPVRVRCPAGEPAALWLAGLQREQAESHLHEFTPLERVAEWSEVPRSLHLFDSLLVFENYPIDAEGWKKAGALALSEVRAVPKTNYALTLMAGLGAELEATLIHDVRRSEAAAVERLARQLAVLLAGIAAAAGDPARTLVELPLLTPEERAQVDRAELRLLDRHGRSVPPGVPGELFRVAPDPEAPLVPTGEIARLRPDGTVEHLGGAGDQAEIAGFGKVDLWEIEAALATLPGVAEAGVVALAQRQREPEGELPAGLVVCWRPAPTLGGADLDGVGLRELLRALLPEPMVPALYFRVTAIPRTAAGRVDRAALQREVGERTAELEVAVVGPRSILEARLLRIWEEVLDRRPIGVTERFFDLGGNSLLALRIIARVRAEFGRDLPPSIFFRGANVEDLALLVRAETDYFSTPLVPIQPAGRRPPLFCVHPIGASVMRYSALAGRLGPDQPFYGLEARHRTPPCASLEELASFYLEAVRVRQPAGPLLLGGWSFGGLVAFEMARQREASGGEVALLVLFDTTAPVPELARPPEEDGFRHDDPRELVRLLDPRGERLAIPFAEIADLAPDAQQELILREAKRVRLVPAELDIAEARRDLVGYLERVRMASVYLPTARLHAPIVLFRCGEREPDFPTDEAAFLAADPTMGWARFTTGGVEMLPVPGTHAEILSEPSLTPLAESLRAVLDLFPNHPDEDRER